MDEFGGDCDWNRYPCKACGRMDHTRTLHLKDGSIESCGSCLAIASLMPAMGEFFALLLRRGEAQALRYEVLGAAHNWKACWRPEDAERRVSHWSRLKGALDRLVEIAGEKRS